VLIGKTIYDSWGGGGGLTIVRYYHYCIDFDIIVMTVENGLRFVVLFLVALQRFLFRSPSPSSNRSSSQFGLTYRERREREKSVCKAQLFRRRRRHGKKKPSKTKRVKLRSHPP
jgi:hypothetical protein